MAEGRRTARGATGRPIGARRRSEEAVEVVTETAPTAQVVDASTRFTQLKDAVSGLRTKAGTGDVERYLLIAGAVLMPLGLVVMILGWQGASNTPYVFEQTPYVISGGLLGLGFMIVGGFLYFGYWLTRMVREQRASADRMADALERIEVLFGGGVAAGENRAGNGSMRSVSARSSRAAAGHPAGAGGFVATPGGSMFHRADCVVVEGKPGLKRVSGKEKGLAPCGICDPLAA